jgi:predicted DNA-binding transcriptional regulator AlpA/DNA-binding CsgD family transcriptional regulator
MPFNRNIKIEGEIHELANDMLSYGFTGQGMDNELAAEEIIFSAADNPNVEHHDPDYSFWRSAATRFWKWKYERMISNKNGQHGGRHQQTVKPEDYERIRLLLNDGISYDVIARQLGYLPNTVNSVRYRYLRVQKLWVRDQLGKIQWQQRQAIPEHIKQDGLAMIRKGELAAMIGVSPSTIDGWRKVGRIPAPIVLSPQVVAWRRSDIERWLIERSLLPEATRDPHTKTMAKLQQRNKWWEKNRRR